MKCDYCESKATVFLTQLVDGQVKKVCLCEPCAKDKGVTDPTGFSMADMLLGGMVGKAMEGMPVVSGSNPRKCPSCGFTLDDLRRVRRFGCADCYKTFAEEVGHMLRSMHKSNQHVGKVPKGLLAKQARDRQLEELQVRLDEAIAAESYEEAADLRDEIQNLIQAES